MVLLNVPPEELEHQLAHYNENKSPAIFIVSSIFFASALILVILRFLTKVVRKLRYHVGDYIIVMAMVLTTGLWIQALLLAKWGTGKHSLRVYREHGSAEGLVRLLQVLFAFMITYSCAHLAIKLSVLFFYRHIFTLVVDWFRWAWYFAVFYVVASWVASMAIVLNQCRPISHFWNEVKGMPGDCGDVKAMNLLVASGIILAVADLMLLVLPLPILALLKRPMKERIMLCALFVLGSITLVASIARVVYINRVVSTLGH